MNENNQKPTSRKKNDRAIRRLTGISVLTALAICLILIANYVTIGGMASINLSLIPIVMAAILYGPLAGTFVGAVVGALTLAAPATGGFLSMNPWGTVIVCILKMALAGLVPGLIFKALGKKHFALGVILASLSAPIVNTGLFALGCYAFFYDALAAYATENSVSVSYTLFVVYIGVNFFLEFGVNAALSPAMVYLCRAAFKRVDLGTDVIGKQPETNPAPSAEAK